MDLPVVPGVRVLPTVDPPGYAVGEDGSVWTHYTAKGRYPDGWRRVSINRRKEGARYCVAHLRHDAGKGKVATRYVHRLVLQAFVGPCPPDCQALHGDGDTANNRLTNLRWGTPLENSADKYKHGTVKFGDEHHAASLTDVDVLAVLYLTEKGLSQYAVAELLEYPQTGVSKILRGMSYPEELARAKAILRDGIAAVIAAGVLPRKQLGA